ncbi:peroxidase family protein [Novosphingobium album (ex Hu et al. 2023)]|uniref:Heme peroxidase family protein n=1 Tax=Novosphingobium album (ex Hu et al. 2023) TaxID=2930093 RepID=A0ABT0B6U1_9SPHN|nr:heme peroxidase family protein [Novosphingobium album (ex Hu et al. 2023)]MCJ2180586.1 heme peroxidase family protein [Novosphingobium album (ex Hu et al. 2023)]
MRSDRFGRILPSAPPLYIDPQALEAIGAKNGPMQHSGAALKTQAVPVAHIFFGQFIDHDITLDVTSSFARLDRAEDTTNVRTPTLDLDCIYGDGPEGSPFLYYHQQPKYNGVKLLTGADMPSATPEQAEDLMRSPHGRAIIGDPRNDENRIVSQLQLGMIRFHNKVVDHFDAAGVSGGELFETAYRAVRWHYQWIVVNDFLKAVVGAPLLADILGHGRKIYRPEHCTFNAAYGGGPFIPVEFSVAAYRFGHSMIPQRIQIQPGKPALEVFGPTLGLGFSPLTDPDAVVNWKQVLDLSDPTVDHADQLDAKLAKDLLDLPFVGAGGVKSLAVRNLLRGQAFLLPSGESVAETCERTVAEIAAVSAKAKALAASAGHAGALDAGTPLWLYILIEAGEIGQEKSPGTFVKGEGLGPVGGRIVAETLIGLQELDPHSYLGSDRSWSPATAPLKSGGVTTLLDLMTY